MGDRNKKAWSIKPQNKQYMKTIQSAGNSNQKGKNKISKEKRITNIQT